MDSRELTEWQAFYNVDPFGEARADMRSAIIAQQVHNTACTKREHLRKVTDFLAVRPRKAPMTWKDVCTFLGGGGE